MFNPLRAGADLRGRIEEIHPETADAATIVIRPGADWAGHIPGQYLRIGIDVDGVRLWRAYSLTHGPRSDGRISITVKAVPEGKVSNHLVHRAQVGTLVHLEQAAGEFVLPTDGGKFLFVTAGSGITPVIGMLRNLFPVADSGVVRLPRSEPYDIIVVHVAPSEPHSIFISNLRELDQAGMINLVARYDDEHGVLDVADLGGPRARPAGAHHVRLRSDRAARRPRGPPRGARPEAAHRAVPGRDPGRRRGRHGQLHQERHHRRGRRRPPDPRRGRGGRRTHAERVPHGHLLPAASCRCARAPCATCAPARSPRAVEGDGVKIQTCINAAAGSCSIDH